MTLREFVSTKVSCPPKAEMLLKSLPGRPNSTSLVPAFAVVAPTTEMAPPDVCWINPLPALEFKFNVPATVTLFEISMPEGAVTAKGPLAAMVPNVMRLASAKAMEPPAAVIAPKSFPGWLSVILLKLLAFTVVCPAAVMAPAVWLMPPPPVEISFNVSVPVALMFCDKVIGPLDCSAIFVPLNVLA